MCEEQIENVTLKFGVKTISWDAEILWLKLTFKDEKTSLKKHKGILSKQDTIIGNF